MSESPEHLVKSYDQELKRLGNLITEMGGIVENQVADAAEAIMQRDTEMAARVVEADPRVDAIEREVNCFTSRSSARWNSSSSACSRCASRWRATCATS